ncbi:RNA pseudouridine synthase [Pseudomonas oligotrophica]|uniref:RNA pseudouridine synthase n=1 Tax=Pseudomonas oligotrophica TaxID=2912055 RepID=UPI001F230264|nr:RNA pseudouridine synthase [Pseudomonas oligotrophica]MCF7203099.1 RNA pseudouridine synthase [Pseudomonas oligotrophica]
MTDAIRLSKLLAEQQGCSRREAELYIEGGWVRVAGQLVETPFHKVEPGQRIELLPGAVAQEVPPVTLLLHKPANLELPTAPAELFDWLQQAGHWADDPSRIAPLKRHLLRQQVVLPLAAAAAGLVILTQQREVVRRLGDTRKPLEEEFVVEVRGEASEAALARLAKGLERRGRPLPLAKASWQSEQRLRLVLKNSRPGDVAALCEAVGLTLIGCRRIRFGRLPMGKLPAGQWRLLGEHERF